MKLGLFALPAAFLVTFAALIACGGGGSDPLTLEEYFEQFEAINADADAEFEELVARFPEGDDAFADDANLPFFKEFFAASPRLLGDILDRTEDLDPPSEVEDAHNEYLASNEDLLVAFEEVFGAINEAETMAEVSALIDEFDVSMDAVTTRSDNACLAVVDIAEANGIAIDVACVDDE